MQQAQQNPQAMQQLQQQMDQLVNQQASEQAKMEAEMTKQLASDEEARISKEAQDPLVKLKQQEIDLKAMETQARLQKDMMVDAEKLDLQRDQLEANTTIDLMRVAADVNKEDSTEAMAVLKENMANTREAMKKTQIKMEEEKKLLMKLRDAMAKIEEAAHSEIKEKDDYLQVCGALMAVTRNMYEKALGSEQTRDMFAAVAESFDYQSEIMQVYKDHINPTIH